MGLNNHGAEVSMARLSGIDRQVPIFVNVAKTADPSIEGEAGVEDYCTSVRFARDLADVIVVNISCPNSGDGRTFEDLMHSMHSFPQFAQSLGRMAQ